MYPSLDALKSRSDGRGRNAVVGAGLPFVADDLMEETTMLHEHFGESKAPGEAARKAYDGVALTELSNL